MKPSPRISTGSLLPALTAALLAAATQSSSAATMVSNLGNLFGGKLQVDYDSHGDFGEIRANTFTTGGSATQLQSVTLDMNTDDGGDGFTVSIYSYGVSGPSALLASLTGSSDPSAAGEYIYADGSSLTLAANTTYFVVASVPQSPPDNYYTWNYTNNGAETGASGWSIGDQSWRSVNGGGSWTQFGFPSAAKFSVQASEITPVPEPGVMLPLPVLLASGLMLRLRRR